MKKLLIFDLDGTLLNTLADLTVAVNYALEQCGYPTHTTDEIRSFVGNGIGKLLERALPVGAIGSAAPSVGVTSSAAPSVEKPLQSPLASLREKFLAYYNEHNADLSTPYPGVAEMLQRLQDRGVLLAVASNKYQQATEKLVAHYFPEIHFSRVCGQRDGFPIKPDPMVVTDILDSLNLSNADALYVGDSGVDMQTAINGNLDAVAVSWGFRPREELDTYHPLAIIDTAEELDSYC